ncbi:MAG: zinc-ribbon domain-containing protein [Deltaproteobacteria bacterium]|nr:zinc-ribbon domain-containing protein [Deltaproteobacteria bacterium]
MIIQCEKCSAKYRLDDSKVGKKGVKVKCTKCQHLFIVRKEEPGAEPAAGTRPPGPPAPPAGHAGEEGFGFSFKEEGAAPPAGHGEDWEAGEKGSAREGFGFGFGEEEKPGEADRPAGETPPGGGTEFDFGFEEEPAGGKETPLEETVPSRQPAMPAPAGKEEAFGGTDFGFEEEKPGLAGQPAGLAGEKIPFPAGERAEEEAWEEKPGEQYLPEKEFDDIVEAAKTTGEKAPEDAGVPLEKPGGKLKWLVLVLVAVLLYGGGAILYVSGAIDPIIHRFSKGPARPVEIKVEGLTGAFTDNEQAGTVFAIEGRIKNSSEEPQAIKMVRGIIYSSSGNPVATRVVSPGRLASKEELKTLPKEELLKHFTDLSAGSVPAKGTIPVMLVFTDLPPDVAEFQVEVIVEEPAP